MQAAVYSGIGSIECREVEKPVIGKGEALLKVKAAAICGTDLRIFKRRFTNTGRRKRMPFEYWSKTASKFCSGSFSRS